MVVFDKCCTRNFYDKTGKICYDPQEYCAGGEECDKKCDDKCAAEDFDCLDACIKE